MINTLSTIQKSIILASIIILIDIFNLPSKYLHDVPITLLIIVVISGTICIVLQIVKSIAKKQYNLISFYSLSNLGLICIISSGIVFILQIAFIETAIYKMSACALILLVGIALVCISKKIKNKKTNNDSSIYTLKDLLENKLQHVKKPVFFEEDEPDYDLLNRNDIINHLTRSILSNFSQKSYVISIDGPWGCGKTTIINNTKRLLKNADNQTIVIDDFEPWMYGTQEAMLVAMYEKILKACGVSYNFSKNLKTINSLINALSSKYDKISIFAALFNTEDTMQINKMKQTLFSFSKFANKKIVIIIDNLDRASDENIILIFKLINLIFDLPNIVYVLSFESDRINAVFNNTKDIEPKFIEKIINQNIIVPSINEETFENLVYVCLENLLNIYGVSEFDDFKTTARLIFLETNDLRTFKRFLNSVFPIVFSDKMRLHKADLLSVQTILFFNYNLYQKIKNHPEFFVSFDKRLEFQLSLKKEQDEKKKKEFFETLYKEHSNYKELICELFSLNDGQFMFNTGPYKSNKTLHSESVKENRISSGHYFDLYFSYSTNSYLELNSKIEDIIKNINSSNDQHALSNYIKESIESFSDSEHKLLFEKLEMFIDDITSDVKLLLAVSLFENIPIIDDRHREFFTLSARSRASYIIALLIYHFNEQEINDFTTTFNMQYNQLYNINSVVYWLNSINEKENKLSKQSIICMNQFYNNMCDYIITNKINLYQSENYREKNIFGLLRNAEDENDKSAFKTYISNLLNPNNVYRVLWDATTMSISNQFHYRIEKKNFDLFFEQIDIVDNLIKNSLPKTDDEQFVYDIYQKFKSPSNLGVEDNSINLRYEREINL